MNETTLKPIKEGKVREIYDNGDSLIMVATDRISCFDVILKNTIRKKGTVLTQMSRFWFDLTSDILPNHMISTDVNDMPEFFRQAAGRVHRPRLYHRKRLGKLSERRYGLRHPSSGRAERIRQASGAHLYAVYQGRDRRSR